MRLSLPLAWLLILGSAASDPLLAAEAHPGTRPNIIVILSDDMGWSDLGAYGGEIETPNLDGLAAGGIRFTQFYNAARCCPTLHGRWSLLGGRSVVPWAQGWRK